MSKIKEKIVEEFAKYKIDLSDSIDSDMFFMFCAGELNTLKEEGKITNREKDRIEKLIQKAQENE